MIKWLKRLLFGRPETEEEREFRRKAHRSILASGAGLSGAGKIEVENEDDEVRAEADSDGGSPDGD